MNIRESMEERELELLSPYAAYSGRSRGRDREEEECDVRTVYQRDRDRILHSKAFRRMKDKTQVFLAPEGDHYRHRLTHTLEVSQIARTIAKALRLNEDLVEAIALGHDLGHTPFGHSGETALNTVHPEGFAHYRQSVRVVEVLEKNGVQMVFFMLTDILDESTELLCCGARAKEYIIDAFDLKENTEKMILKGVVSRKKQLIPTLVSELQQ